jgi:DNA-directed RNA polymerase specialized sigma24 family protein
VTTPDRSIDDLPSVIEGCLKRDRGSQRLLYYRYYGWALRIVYRYIGSYEHSRDVVHESFARLFHSFEQLLQKEETGTEVMLLCRMRDRFVRSAVRWVQTHSGPSSELEGYNTVQPDDWADPGPTDNPAETAFHRELMIRLVTLPGKLRLVFNLRVIDGYAPSQVTGLLDIPERRLEKYLSQARSLLRLPPDSRRIQKHRPSP